MLEEMRKLSIPARVLIFSIYTAIVIAIAFLINLQGTKLNLIFTAHDFMVVILNYMILVLVLTPLARTIRFVHFSKTKEKLARLAAVLLFIVFLVAIPEELIFRAIFQTYFTQVFSSPWYGLAVASILFGLFHNYRSLNQKWNLKFILLSTIAGISLGLTFMFSNSIIAPILLHSLIGFTWHLFFKPSIYAAVIE